MRTSIGRARVSRGRIEDVRWIMKSSPPRCTGDGGACRLAPVRQSSSCRTTILRRTCESVGAQEALTQDDRRTAALTISSTICSQLRSCCIPAVYRSRWYRTRYTNYEEQRAYPPHSPRNSSLHERRRQATARIYDLGYTGFDACRRNSRRAIAPPARRLDSERNAPRRRLCPYAGLRGFSRAYEE
ncbi:hypothetical protein OH77DRAFT_493302 [Trametes cingulata]|nr:hypothetical protein OH77DRAFT_493302 [Trametes cingulata]